MGRKYSGNIQYTHTHTHVPGFSVSPSEQHQSSEGDESVSAPTTENPRGKMREA